MSAIVTPFDGMDAEGFASEMKPKISGAHLTLEYANIESSIAKVAIDCLDILGETLYEKLCKKTASTDTGLNEKALDFLQRSMLHFCLYEHLIFLITQIKDTGVTVAKDTHETTVFKYLQDELDVKLVSLGWFWMNRLIRLLNEYRDKFPDWKADDDILAGIDINLSDFDKWVGIRDEYFIIVAKWLIREVWMDCVLSRAKNPEKNDEMVRALCYEVVGRACKRLAYYCLPEPIRKDINNEMGKNHAAEADKTIREKIADIYLNKALSYWTGWDSILLKEERKANPKARPVYNSPSISENDAFVC